MSMTIMSMSVMFIREFRLDILMREYILGREFVFLEESVFIERSEELVLLDVRVSHVGFLRVDSGEVLSFEHVLEFERRVAKESRDVEIESSRLVVIVVFEHPKSINSVEDVVSRVSFINGFHFVSMEVVPEVVSHNH